MRLNVSAASVRPQQASTARLLLVAWGVMLIFSILPEIIAQELLHNSSVLPLIMWSRLTALALLMLACALQWPPWRILWKYPAMLLVLAWRRKA